MEAAPLPAFQWAVLSGVIFAALTFLAAFCGLFAWLVAIAFRTNTLHGLGWSATRAEKPCQYWSGVAVYLVNLAVGALFFFIAVETIIGR